MSTKSTLIYDDDFHFYEESFDTDFVYLQLSDKNCLTVDADGVTIAIPSHVWEAIRESTSFDISIADLSDDDLKTMVVQAVKERMDEFLKTNNSLVGMLGCLAYGSVKDPIDQQIASGIRHWTEIRARQQALRNKLLKIKQKNHRQSK